MKRRGKKDNKDKNVNNVLEERVVNQDEINHVGDDFDMEDAEFAVGDDNDFVSPEHVDAPLEGFDIELNKEKIARIDRLVDDYEKLISNRVDQAYIEETSWSDKLADKIALFGGSWRFIVWFFFFLLGWILWNEIPLLARFRFDPEPFILMNLLLSLIAAFQAPIIMMSQNRQAARDKRESIIDFAINYKSEFEINDIQKQLAMLNEQLVKMNARMRRIEKHQYKYLQRKELQ